MDGVPNDYGGVLAAVVTARQKLNMGLAWNQMSSFEFICLLLHAESPQCVCVSSASQDAKDSENFLCIVGLLHQERRYRTPALSDATEHLQVVFLNISVLTIDLT